MVLIRSFLIKGPLLSALLLPEFRVAPVPNVSQAFFIRVTAPESQY